MRRNLSRREFIRLGAATTAVAAGTTALPGVAGAAGISTTLKPHPLTQSHDSWVLLDWISHIYDLVRQERFTPTSAARAYGAIAVGAYESVVGGMPTYRSLGGQLNGLGPPAGNPPSRRIHWPLALNRAVEQTALAVFDDRSDVSREAISAYANTISGSLAPVVSQSVMSASEAHGRTIGRHVAAWMASDGYHEILGLPYTPPVGEGLWERTPPNFGFALEPYWERVRPMALPSADFCAPPPPISYSTQSGSAFWNQANAVYQQSLANTDRERDIALFWRDNPDGTTGLPSGHWMLIASIAVRDKGLDLARATEVLAMTGISLADAFTSCWTEKYRRNLVRPVTYIRNNIDANWASFVNSPAFPEYTSGHSVGSGAASSTLRALLGSFSFIDDSGVPYGRSAFAYDSFRAAAAEAAISRLYGGIHFPMAIEVGLEQGEHVSRVVRDRVRLRVRP